MKIRKWVAWKLVQLAAKLYDAEHEEFISITELGGTEVARIWVTGDEYGSGVTGGPTTIPGYKIVYGIDGLAWSRP
jgi:hypothetical protein